MIDNTFPLIWNNPEEAKLCWFHDPTHGRDPLMPLDFDLRIKPMVFASQQLNKQWGVYISGRMQLFNGYVYSAMVRTNDDPDQVKCDYKHYEEIVSAKSFELDELWEKVYLPEIKEHLSYWKAFDLETANWNSLQVHLEETIRRAEQMWILHHRILLPSLYALSEFEEMVKGLFEAEAPFSAYDLLTGIGNKTVESGIRLWQLSQQAMASSVVGPILQETEAVHVLDKLLKTEEGRIFWSNLSEYLAEYGHNSDILYLNQPCWQENPIPVFKILQHYMKHPERNPERVQKQHSEFREEAIAVAISRFEGYPLMMLDEFERHLKAAQIANKLTEDHHYWIDASLYYYIRQIGLAIGKRLVEQQLLDKSDDIFYLSLDELRSLTLETVIPFQTIIKTRQINYQHYANYTPPPKIGSGEMSIIMDDLLDSSITRALQKFSAMNPVEETSELNQLKGYPGASGKTTGLAKVVCTLAEADKIKPGDILIAPSTLPAWTPLFSMVSAIVTDAGGVLSHTAIVAREYGIPAVLGTQSATLTIQDGQMLEVDGTNGLVRILDNNS